MPHFALSLRLSLRHYPFALWRQVDSFQTDLSQSWLIPSDAAHALAITFGLTVADVRTDAHDVATWHGLNHDDLLTSIGTRRRLDVATVAIYLRNLRTALARVGK